MNTFMIEFILFIIFVLCLLVIITLIFRNRNLEIRAEIIEKRIYKKLCKKLLKENKEIKKILIFVKKQSINNRIYKKNYEKMQ